jgi:citrate lyase subunit beta/citryl-CoA lyase
MQSRYLAQRSHLTAPATVAKYVDAAVTRSDADLVMLDLEDSIPRGNDALLAEGRDAIVRAFLDLDWGGRLRFFRPRGAALDPAHADIEDVILRAEGRLDGLVYPKIEGPEEVRALDATLTRLERSLPPREDPIRVALLIESVVAEERAFEIAAASTRVVSLIFGAVDYASSLGLVVDAKRDVASLATGASGLALDLARVRVVKAAASVGVPAIAEMTLNFPTKNKSEEERRAAIDECRGDAERSRALGFRGKWTGIPAQVPIVNEVFTLRDAVIFRALTAVRAFLQAERAGRGATMIDGLMYDRANDRLNRVVLETAFATGRLDPMVAREVGVGGERPRRD